MTNKLSFVCLALASALSAQPNWIKLTSTTPPQARYGHALAYDQARNEVVLFGGHNEQAFLGDTWVYSPITGWAQKQQANPPQARRWHALAYDTFRQRVVLFGGGSNAVVDYGDTWEWNGSSWNQVFVSGPPARQSHVMSYDQARGVVVLYGGMSGNVYQNDTWEFDGTAWKQRTPASPPAGRAYSSMIYDVRRGKHVLFGGNTTGSATQGDTWEYDGAAWTQRTPATSPPVRYGHALAYDMSRERTVLFGGRNTANLADTWEFDGTTWIQRSPIDKPMARYSARMVYAWGQFGTLLFGGSTFPGVLSDTFRYNPLTPAVYQTFGSGCGSPAPSLMQSYDQFPYVGGSFTVLLSSLPANRPVSIFLGASDTKFSGLPLPLDLTPIGMSACTLYVSQDLVVNVPTNGTNGSWTVAVPNVASLAGGTFYNQALVFAPGANPLGVILSNAGKGTLRIK